LSGWAASARLGFDALVKAVEGLLTMLHVRRRALHQSDVGYRPAEVCGRKFLVLRIRLMVKTGAKNGSAWEMPRKGPV
jgi:hypothetical protein